MNNSMIELKTESTEDDNIGTTYTNSDKDKEFNIIQINKEEELYSSRKSIIITNEEFLMNQYRGNTKQYLFNNGVPRIVLGPHCKNIIIYKYRVCVLTCLLGYYN